MNGNIENATTLDMLPQATLQCIFCYGSTADRIRCERVCKAFKLVLRNETKGNLTWMAPLGNRATRMQAYEFAALEEVIKWQSTESSIILSVITPLQWKTLVESWIRQSQQLRSEPSKLSTVEVRGDALAVLLEIIESYMIACFQRALLISKRDQLIPAETPETRAALSKSDLDIQDVVAKQPFDGHHSDLWCCEEPLSWGISGYSLSTATSSSMGRSVEEKIVRRLAFQSGVVKMKPEVIPYMWYNLLQVGGALVIPAAVAMCFVVEYNDDDIQPKRIVKIDKGESFRDFPPYSRLEQAPVQYPELEYPEDIPLRMTYTVVSKQITDQAQAYGLPKVHGDGWICGTDKCQNQSKNDECIYCNREIRVARAMYLFLSSEEEEDGSFVDEMAVDSYNKIVEVSSDMYETTDEENDSDDIDRL